MPTYIKTENGIIKTVNPEFYTNGEVMPNSSGQVAFRLQQREKLKSILNNDDTIYCVIRYRSRYNQTTHVDFFVIHDNKPRYLTQYFADILLLRAAKNTEGIVLKHIGADECVANIETYIGKKLQYHRL